MSIENRSDEQNYDSTSGVPNDAPASASYSAVNGSASASGQGVPPYRDAYSTGQTNAYATGAVPGAPNPGLAALLGFIPGVGAMYNGQFAKGLAHIAIFSVFCSLSKNVNGIFGLFIAGWVLYMAFEAYQTAVARRDGLPLPDPFGLNHIGERLGFRANPNFNSFWAHGAPPPDTTRQPGASPYAQGEYRVPQQPFHVDPSGTVYRAGAAPEGFVPPLAANQVPVPGNTDHGFVPPPPVAPYGMPPYAAAPLNVPPVPPMPPMPPVTSSGLPAGAIWLIGLGLFALLGSIRAFDFLEGEATGGIFLIGLSLFLFWRRWSQSRQLYTPGSPAARWSVVNGVRGAGVLFVIGLLTLLQGLRVVYWENSWPFLLIAIGVLLLVERFALNQMAAAPYAVAQPDAQAAEQSSSTSILPRYTPAGDDTNSREGL